MRCSVAAAVCFTIGVVLSVSGNATAAPYPLITSVSGPDETVAVYGRATTSLVSLHIVHSGGDAGNDYRPYGSSLGDTNVLDLHIGVPGAMYDYALRTRANPAPGYTIDQIDGFYGHWRRHLGSGRYSNGAIPLNISSTTTFDSVAQERVTDITIPMVDMPRLTPPGVGSLDVGDLLTISGRAHSIGSNPVLYFPDGINHGDPNTYSATLTIVPLPGPAMMGLAGLSGLCLTRRRRPH